MRATSSRYQPIRRTPRRTRILAADEGAPSVAASRRKPRILFPALLLASALVVGVALAEEESVVTTAVFNDHSIRIAAELFTYDKWAAIKKYGNITDWDTRFVTDMSGLFAYSSTFNEDISRWRLDSVTTTRNMFHRAFAFEGRNLSLWSVGSVTDMRNMFSSTKNFREVLCWDNIHPDVLVSQMFCESQGSFDPNCATTIDYSDLINGTGCGERDYVDIVYAPPKGQDTNSHIAARVMQRLAVVALILLIFVPFLVCLTYDIAKNKWQESSSSRARLTLGLRRSLNLGEVNGGEEDATVADSELSGESHHELEQQA